MGTALQSLALYAFLLNLVLIFPVFLPNLKDIGLFDEAGYINSGRELVENFGLPAYGDMPLPTFFYALTYLPVQASPYWLIHSCAIGRLILFILLWLSAYLIAKQLSPLSSRGAFIGLLVISPALSSLVRIGSHALFAALSALAFWKVLSFYNTKGVRHLWFASMFAGLAALARGSEGAILFFSLLISSVIMSVPVRQVSTSLLACIVPFALIVGGYVSVYALTNGKLGLQSADYSYTAFEQGHGLAYQNRYKTANYYVEGQIEARQLFGTPEENRYSILTAIRHNPKAYLQRVPRLISIARYYATNIYGGGVGLIFFLLAVRGMIELVRRKSYLLLCLMLLWPLYVVLYFLLVFQETHFLLPYFIVLSLASVGLTAVVSNFERGKEYYLWAGVLVIFAIFAAVKRGEPPGEFWALLVFLLGLGITYMVIRRSVSSGGARAVGITMLLSVLLLLRGGYPAPKFRTLGASPDERAALFMRSHFRPGAAVGSYQPSNVWIAKLTYVPMYRSRLPDINSETDLFSWVANLNLAGIYVDDKFKENETSLWTLIEGQIGKGLEEGFSSEDGVIKVLLVRPPSK